MDVVFIFIFSCVFVDILKGMVLISDRIKLRNTNGSAGDFFGSSVAINKDFIAIGTCKDDINGKKDMGSVTIFQRNYRNYIKRQKIIPEDGETMDNFGYSVALGDNFLVVGSIHDDTGGIQGSVYFYQYREGEWRFQQKVIATNVVTSVQFGISVAIDQNIAVIGGGSGKFEGTEYGTCHVFHYNGTSWLQVQRLITKEGAYDNTYGTSVAVSNDFIALGVSYLSINKTNNAGMVYLFKRDNDSLWRQHRILHSKIPVRNGWFGRSVSMDKNRLVIGAEGENSGKGNVYVYYYVDNVWILKTNLMPADRNYSHHFGFAVSIDLNTIAIGSSRSKGHGVGPSGIPYIFKLTRGKWRQHSKLLANDDGYDLIGKSLAVFNDSVVVGRYARGLKNGSAYLFSIPSISIIGNITLIHRKPHMIFHTDIHERGIEKNVPVKVRSNSNLLLGTIIPVVIVLLLLIIFYRYKRKMFSCRDDRVGSNLEGLDNIGITADDVSLIASTQA